MPEIEHRPPPPAVRFADSQAVAGAREPAAGRPAPAGRDLGGDLRLAFEASDSAILICGPSGRVLHANGGALRLFGYSAAELVGQRVIERLAGPHTDPRAVAELSLRLAAALDGDVSGWRTELLLYDARGRPLWVAGLINPILGANGAPHQFVAALTDITDSKLHEQLQQRVLTAIASDQPSAEVMALLCREVERMAPEVVASVLRVDAQGRLRPMASPSMPAEIGRALDGLPIGPAVGSCGTCAWRGEPVMVADIATDPLWTPYKHLFLPLGLVACWSSPIRAGDGKVIGTFAFYFREPILPTALHEKLVAAGQHLGTLLLERDGNRASLQRAAHFDALTGLPSRALVRADGERALRDAARNGASVAAIVINLDRFKQVNDSAGHAAGDRLLAETARRLQAQLREGDLVGRLAGDEFVAFLPDCDARQVAGFVERFLAALAEPLAIGGSTVQPGASMGVAIFPDDAADADALLRHADLAMQQAKAESPGHWRRFDPAMDEALRERNQLEVDLRHALRHDGLELHYQPQVDAVDNSRLCGVEALLRWQHPVLGAVPPMRFVALAEACGLIQELGRWVLGRACAQMSDWRRRGVPVPRVAINLSPLDFKDAGLPGRVSTMLARHALVPDDLVVEITEGVMLESDAAVLATIDAVRATGVNLSMDDFGTGWSSLAHLLRLPIGELKLDRSFVCDLEANAAARALSASVLRIAESLDMQVVAEGVETEAQRRFLAERGCAMLQGYLFSRPLPPEALELWLQARAPALAA